MLNLPEFIRPLLTVPVAVLGGGVSGRAAAELIKRIGGEVQIYDENAGMGNLESFRGPSHRLVVFSPGFVAGHPWMVAARAAGIVCLSELDFASLFWRGSVVAVTGTNGKTTLTEFLTYALRSVGRDAFAVGNIGQAFCQTVVDREGGAPDSIAVCEVSSFQAESLRHFRADAALWTNFAEDHLERHGSMADYFSAKWRLFERTVGGLVLAGSSVQHAAEQFGQTLPDGSVVDTEHGSGDLLLRGTVFAEQPQRENFLIAAAWWREAGLSEPALYVAAQTFTVGPHRLARVAEVDGVTWWNDSKATNFHATEAALGRFGGPVILIAGGKAKGGDIAAFAKRIGPRLKEVLLIGETRNILATFFGATAVPHRACSSLADAVEAAASVAISGDHILLSPGFASLDQFRGYTDRGEQFEQLVRRRAELTSVSP